VLTVIRRRPMAIPSPSLMTSIAAATSARL
jgi:hypothetical protein